MHDQSDAMTRRVDADRQPDEPTLDPVPADTYAMPEPRDAADDVPERHVAFDDVPERYDAADDVPERYDAADDVPDDRAVNKSPEPEVTDHDPCEPVLSDVDAPGPATPAPTNVTMQELPGDDVEDDREEARTDEAPPVHDEEPDLKPGAVAAEPATTVWSEADAQGIRDRWRELQLRFIDDPRSVAGEAAQLVEEAVAGLTAQLNARKDALDFLDRLLGL